MNEWYIIGFAWCGLMILWSFFMFYIGRFCGKHEDETRQNTSYVAKGDD